MASSSQALSATPRLDSLPTETLCQILEGTSGLTLLRILSTSRRLRAVTILNFPSLISAATNSSTCHNFWSSFPFDVHPRNFRSYLRQNNIQPRPVDEDFTNAERLIAAKDARDLAEEKRRNVPDYIRLIRHSIGLSRLYNAINDLTEFITTSNVDPQTTVNTHWDLTNLAPAMSSEIFRILVYYNQIRLYYRLNVPSPSSTADGDDVFSPSWRDRRTWVERTLLATKYSATLLSISSSLASDDRLSRQERAHEFAHVVHVTLALLRHQHPSILLSSPYLPKRPPRDEDGELDFSLAEYKLNDGEGGAVPMDLVQFAYFDTYLDDWDYRMSIERSVRLLEVSEGDPGWWYENARGYARGMFDESRDTVKGHHHWTFFAD